MEVRCFVDPSSNSNDPPALWKEPIELRSEISSEFPFLLTGCWRGGALVLAEFSLLLPWAREFVDGAGLLVLVGEPLVSVRSKWAIRCRRGFTSPPSTNTTISLILVSSLGSLFFSPLLLYLEAFSSIGNLLLLSTSLATFPSRWDISCVGTDKPESWWTESETLFLGEARWETGPLSIKVASPALEERVSISSEKVSVPAQRSPSVRSKLSLDLLRQTPLRVPRTEPSTTVSRKLEKPDSGADSVGLVGEQGWGLVEWSMQVSFKATSTPESRTGLFHDS
ncbi:hypothetical protein E2C01_051544 [Portunus trituberculatus]|uniref:Uncharacterized protein n=1 Tax=Portunus trituberculatus TaxID=210409 RepID=A0A5B7GBW7_PORTR|nr:hypothetical protein [Portunus trituberculatus]